MSSDTIMKDDDGVRYSYDNLRTQGWLDGHARGAEIAAQFIKAKATELFNAGKDEEAKRMRQLGEEIAQKIVPELRSNAAKHKEDHPIVVTEDE